MELISIATDYLDSVLGKNPDGFRPAVATIDMSMAQNVLVEHQSTDPVVNDYANDYK